MKWPKILVAAGIDREEERKRKFENWRCEPTLLPCNEPPPFVEFHFEGDELFPIEAVIRKDICLRARVKTFFYVKLRYKNNHMDVAESKIPYMLGPIENKNSRLLTAKSVGYVRGNKFPISIENVSTRDIILCKGNRIAQGTEIEIKEVCPLFKEEMGMEGDLNLSRDSCQVASAQKRCGGEVSEEEKKEIQKLCECPGIEGTEEPLLQLLIKHRKAIFLEGDELGKTNLLEFKIDLIPGAKPAFRHPYKVAHSLKPVLEAEMQNMIKHKIIEPSTSPWSAPIILVKKKGINNFRPAVDYRFTNKMIQTDSFPLPNLTDIIQSLGEARVFSSIDLFSAYWQCGVEEASRPITAFSTETGSYQFLRLPFGIKTACSAFSRLMSQLLSGLVSTEVWVYLDDVILFSKDVPSHFKTLDDVLTRIENANLKIKLQKCVFFKVELIFLGFLVNKDGIQPNPEKVKVVKEYPVPKSIENVRSFIGFTGFYRQFIEGYSRIALPLTAMFKKGAKFIWTTTEQHAFETLRDKLLNEPILKYPDYNKQFFVASDASKKSIGAVLLQDYNGIKKPISYASRLMTSAEKNYNVTSTEALALIYGLKKFRNIIYGCEITALTDHLPLLQMFSKSAALEGRLQRWGLLISDFEVKLLYNPGKLHVLPDTLSRLYTARSILRRPYEKKNRLKVRFNDVPEVKLIEEDQKYCVKIRKFKRKTIKIWSVDELIKGQKEDVYFGNIRRHLVYGKHETPLPKDLNEYYVKERVLYKKAMHNNRQRELVVIPKSLVPIALELCHSSEVAGHLGIDRTLQRVKERFHFINARGLVTDFCSTCKSCVLFKGKSEKTSTIFDYPIPPRPWHTCGMDILGPMPTTALKKHKYILVFTDHLSRYVEIVSIPNRKAETVALAFQERIIMNYSTPTKLISDCALEFCSAVVNLTCKAFGVNKVQTTPHYAAANGIVERSNRKILSILRNVANINQDNWDECLSSVQTAINSAYNRSIGDTPHYVLYLEDKILPFDEEPTAEGSKTIPEFIQKQNKLRTEMYALVKASLECSKEEMKLYKRKGNPKKDRVIYEGQRVYLKELKTVGLRKKLVPRFRGPFRVITVLGNNRYLVRKIGGKDTLLKVHQEMVKIVPEDTIRSILAPRAREPFGYMKHNNLKNMDPMPDRPQDVEKLEEGVEFIRIKTTQPVQATNHAEQQQESMEAGEAAKEDTKSPNGASSTTVVETAQPSVRHKPIKPIPKVRSKVNDDQQDPSFVMPSWEGEFCLQADKRITRGLLNKEKLIREKELTQMLTSSTVETEKIKDERVIAEMIQQMNAADAVKKASEPTSSPNTIEDVIVKKTTPEVHPLLPPKTSIQHNFSETIEKVIAENTTHEGPPLLPPKTSIQHKFSETIEKVIAEKATPEVSSPALTPFLPPKYRDKISLQPSAHLENRVKRGGANSIVVSDIKCKSKSMKTCVYKVLARAFKRTMFVTN